MRREFLLVARIVPLFLFAPLFAQAALYAPGATLDPACGPTDLNCGVESVVGAGTVGQVPYYAADGTVLTATSTFTVLSNGNVGVGVFDPSVKLEVAGDIISRGLAWTPRLTPADNNWASIAYGNGLFVAIATSGSGNRIMTSPDGINWTLRNSPADLSWNGVTYANGLFVAVSSSDKVMTSTNGIDWTLHTVPLSGWWYTVTYGNGLFVAVSGSNTNQNVMTSPDGVTWTVRTTPISNSLYTVAYGDGRFVALSMDGTGQDAITSTDGITWVQHNTPDNGWYSVTYGNGLFVAVAQNYVAAGTRAMYSSDGATWHLGSNAPDNDWNMVTYGDGLFVAVADSGTNRIMTSADGINWTARVSPTDNNWGPVAYGDGVFVSASYTGTGNRVMTSGKSLASITPTDNIFHGVTSFMGNVGIGTSSPIAQLAVGVTGSPTDYGLYVDGGHNIQNMWIGSPISSIDTNVDWGPLWSRNAIVDSSGNKFALSVASQGWDSSGLIVESNSNSSGDVSNPLYIEANASHSSGVVDHMWGVYDEMLNLGAGSITNANGIFLQQTSNVGGGSISNLYGLNISNQAVGSLKNYAIYTNQSASSTNSQGSYALYNNGAAPSYFGGSVGIGTTSPWRSLSVAGTVGFSGLTGASGAGSLCLSADNEVVYNSGSDSCLPSLRSLKHDISILQLSGTSTIMALDPVSFIYNYDASNTVRYGFIAEDTSKVDAHLGTYDIHGNLSGVDDRSLIAILVKALKEVLTTMQGFAHQFVTDQLCVRATDGTPVCLNGDQLKALLSGGATQPTTAAAWTPEPSTGSTDTTTASSTTPVDTTTSSTTESGGTDATTTSTTPPPPADENTPPVSDSTTTPDTTPSTATN